MPMGDAVFVRMIMVMRVMIVMVVRPRGMGMVVTAATGRAMAVGVALRMGMLVRVMALRVFMIVMRMVVSLVPRMRMPMMRMVVMMVAVIMVGMVATGVVISAALGLEGTAHHGHRTALAAHHFRQHMVVLDIDRVRGDLGRGMAIADMPGDAHQPQRVLRADFEQALRRGLDPDQTSILELDGVAIVQARGLVEIQQDVETLVTLQGDAAAVAIFMIERDGLDDLVGFDRSLANDGGGAKHDGGSVLTGALWSDASEGQFHHRQRRDASPRGA